MQSSPDICHATCSHTIHSPFTTVQPGPTIQKKGKTPKEMSNQQLSNPSQWATGAEPPTEKQTSFLATLADTKGESGLDVNSLNKSEASVKIDELKNKPTASDSSTPSATAARTTTASSSTSSEEEEDAEGAGEKLSTATTGGAQGSSSSSSSNGSAIQDPSKWATGGDPATGKQTGYIAVMAKEAGEEVGDMKGMGKTEASQRIEELKGRTGM